MPLFLAGVVGCSEPATLTVQKPESDMAPPRGLHPNIKPGDVSADDAASLSLWIQDAITLLQSPEFKSNFQRASLRYPELFVSRKEDLVPAATVLARLHLRDPGTPNLWWPETHVSVTGKTAVRSLDQTGFGFEGSRNAGAGPKPGQSKLGEIELGRLHLARYTQGDTVEKSCALNTMVHEISHTLSERPGQFWMHILDSEDNVTAPNGVFEASYFIGTVAQCTYLQTSGRISQSELQDCMMTFSDPSAGSRFKSLANACARLCR